MSIGHWIVRGDKTTCGGSVLEGSDKKFFAGMPTALNGHTVSCGKHPGTFHIVGGHPGDTVHGVPTASTLYSRSSCPCQAHLIPSVLNAWHGPYQGPQYGRSTSAPHSRTGSRTGIPSELHTMDTLISGLPDGGNDAPVHAVFTEDS